MEYEVGDMENGELPKELIDYHDSNSRLRQDLEIYFDETECDKELLFKVSTDGEEIELIRAKERGELETIIHNVKKDHEQMIQKMREKVEYIREIKKGGGKLNRVQDEDVKKLLSVEKRRLIQFRTEDGRQDRSDQPEQKRRKITNDHKSRCSDLKVQFFQKTKEMLDVEEAEGLIASWERVYKYIMNNHVKDKTKEVQPVMKEPSKMLNELRKAVDLDEIMNEEQNLYQS
jgi:hypothetical protein